MSTNAFAWMIIAFALGVGCFALWMQSVPFMIGGFGVAVGVFWMKREF